MASGRTLFVSDLHLDAEAPSAVEQFCAFLRTEAVGSDALYILGDLFEYWIGDDDDEPVRTRVSAALRELTRGGVPCFVQHGNRDFLLGSRFMDRSGCQLLPDPAVREFGGKRFVLTHGDALCTADRSYQRFRRLVRTGLLQLCWRAVPLALRRWTAARVRRHSRAHTSRQASSIMDVTPAAVAGLLHATRGDCLVHGHTHRPGVHQLQVDGRTCTRIVLGDWHGQADVLVVTRDGRFERGVPGTGTGPR
jgi:UDP-2,3-diacylglucosamine hydrolase